jgi:hypothetical protein
MSDGAQSSRLTQLVGLGDPTAAACEGDFCAIPEQLPQAAEAGEDTTASEEPGPRDAAHHR